MNQVILRALSILSYVLAIVVFGIMLSEGTASSSRPQSTGINIGAALTPLFTLVVVGAILGGLATGLGELKRIREASEAAHS